MFRLSPPEDNQHIIQSLWFCLQHFLKHLCVGTHTHTLRHTQSLLLFPPYMVRSGLVTKVMVSFHIMKYMRYPRFTVRQAQNNKVTAEYMYCVFTQTNKNIILTEFWTLSQFWLVAWCYFSIAGWMWWVHKTAVRCGSCRRVTAAVMSVGEKPRGARI